MNLKHILNFCSGTEPLTSGVQPFSARPAGHDKTPSGRIFPTPLHNEPEDDDQDLNTMSGNQHKHEHNARGLPHRGSVSDLFGGSGGSAAAAAAADAVSAVQAKEARDGVAVWLDGMGMHESQGCYRSRLVCLSLFLVLFILSGNVYAIFFFYLFSST